MNKRIMEFRIKQPRQSRIATRIAHGLHTGKPLQEIFKSINISSTYGYSVWRRFRQEIEEIRDSLERGDEKTQSALEIAKKLLREKSPELAQVLVDLALDKEAPKRERVQAAKSGLQIAGVQEERGERLPAIDMRRIIMNIHEGKIEDPTAIGEIVRPRNGDTK